MEDSQGNRLSWRELIDKGVQQKLFNKRMHEQMPQLLDRFAQWLDANLGKDHGDTLKIDGAHTYLRINQSTFDMIQTMLDTMARTRPTDTVGMQYQLQVLEAMLNSLAQQVGIPIELSDEAMLPVFVSPQGQLLTGIVVHRDEGDDDDA